MNNVIIPRKTERGLRPFLWCCSVMIVVSLISLSIAGAYDGYLQEGTFALNPHDKRQIFLYVPGMTPIYSIDEEDVLVGTAPFSDKPKRAYRLVATQDGIQALILKASIRFTNSALADFDFVINRRIPFCRELEAFPDIWNKFSQLDEGPGWFALYARNAGKVLEVSEDKYKVRMAFAPALGPEEGYIPKKRDGRSIEELGYLTFLNTMSADYQFKEAFQHELSTACSERNITRDSEKLFTEIQGYLQTKVGVSIDPTSFLAGKLASKVIKYLGLDASISLEAFLKGEFKKTDETETVSTITYGAEGESWVVNSVQIDKKTAPGIDDATPYRNIGSMLIKKVYTCKGAQLASLDYISILLIPARDLENTQEIVLTPQTIKNLGLICDDRFPSLVSLNNQFHYFKLLDYLVIDEGLPKGIANYVIKEINLSAAR
ncbi:MAG: hypothetical protein JSV40_13770 [Deltaproteobacteria bacterium]|nr:MAG: hypothetical protein JSV40_13770 [Deltaproteobacteria bacterium]